jgi:hypothetical protein
MFLCIDFPNLCNSVLNYIRCLLPQSYSGSLNRLRELQMVMCMPLMGICREHIFVFHHRTQKIHTSLLFFHYDSKRIILCTCMGIAQNQQSFCCCVMSVMFLF